MMVPQDACHTSSQLSIQSGKGLDNVKRVTQARSRSTSAGSSAGCASGSDFASIVASPDCRVASLAGPLTLSHLDHPDPFFNIDRPSLLSGFGKEDGPPPRRIYLPPGLEDATPAARSFAQSQNHEHDDYDDYDEDAFAWAVASSAAEMALGSPMSASGKPSSAALLEAIDISSPVLSLDMKIPGAPGFPPPPPLQAPVLDPRKSLAASCAPPTQSPALAPQTKPPACASPTQPLVLSPYTNFPTCDPPTQLPIVVSHRQGAPMLPPPALPPNMSGKLGEPQFLPPPMLPPSVSMCTSQPPVVPPPCQPPVLRAEIQQQFAPRSCRPPVLGVEVQTPVDVPPPTHAPTLYLAEAVPEPTSDMSALPSVGSEGHHLGSCKPCAFFHTKGCGSGSECQFCHLCMPGEKKRRMNVKRRGHVEHRGQGA